MTPNIRCLAACLPLLSAFGLPTAAQAKPRMTKPRMTRYQVIQTFQRFSLRVTGDRRAETFITRPDQPPLVTINYYDADHLPSEPSQRSMIVGEDHPNGFWKIEAQQSFSMEIDDQTGHVLSYINFTASEDGKYKAAGKTMPKQEVRTRAEAALLAAGVSLEHLKLAYVQEYQNSDFAYGHEMWVDWKHTFHGIPADRAGASVCLGAETGKVISLSVSDPNRWIDPPTAVENITREQAVAIARAQLYAVGYKDLPLASADKRLMPSNRYWYYGTDTTPLSRQTRVVWDCAWQYLSGNYQVWIDTQTGAVIGGEHEKSL